jgi:hypothetical protein
MLLRRIKMHLAPQIWVALQIRELGNVLARAIQHPHLRAPAQAGGGVEQPIGLGARPLPTQQAGGGLSFPQSLSNPG